MAVLILVKFGLLVAVLRLLQVSEPERPWVWAIAFGCVLALPGVILREEYAGVFLLIEAAMGSAVAWLILCWHGRSDGIRHSVAVTATASIGLLVVVPLLAQLLAQGILVATGAVDPEAMS